MKLVEFHLYLCNPVTASVVQSGSGILTASVLSAAFRPTGTYQMNAFVDAAAGLS